MYILDTNAFYYAAGISECTYDVEKLRTLIHDNDVFISSTSLFEFLIKYRSDINAIHKGGKYLWENDIKLAGNIFNPLPTCFSGDIMNITEEGLSELCDDVLKNKIDIESRFITLLFDMCLFSAYYFTAYLDGKEPSEFCIKVFHSVYRMFAPTNLEVFGSVFTEGYKTDDCENYVRKCFYNLLAFEMEKGIPFIEHAKGIKEHDDIINIDEWLPTEDYDIKTETINNKMKNKTSNEFLQRLAIDYWKKNNDPGLKKYIKNIKPIFDSRIKFAAMQDYFYDTLISIMTSGAALRKNDFLDALILCNLDEQHTLITYDNGVIKRLEKRKNEYSKYEESVEVIEELKQLT